MTFPSPHTTWRNPPAPPSPRLRCGPRPVPRRGRRAQPDVGHALLPAPRLVVQIRVADELPAVEEVLPHVADRPLHLALRAGPVRAAGAGTEAPVEQRSSGSWKRARSTVEASCANSIPMGAGHALSVAPEEDGHGDEFLWDTPQVRRRQRR